jgi:DnaJ-class molecular chaperone
MNTEHLDRAIADAQQATNDLLDAHQAKTAIMDKWNAIALQRKITIEETREACNREVLPAFDAEEKAIGKLVRANKEVAHEQNMVGKCRKCNGRGQISWSGFQNGRCFDCNGSGKA